MPGYIIHLAVGKVYCKNNKIEDIQSFIKGVIAPDQEKDKRISHYGPNSSNPNLKEYMKQNPIFDSFREGYFLHLVTDYLFYNKYLEKWGISIYDDYDILNKRIIEKYKIEIPKEIENGVGYKDGKLSIIDENSLYEFIETVGKIKLKEDIIKNINKCNFRKDKKENECEK